MSISKIIADGINCITTNECYKDNFECNYAFGSHAMYLSMRDGTKQVKRKWKQRWQKR